MTPGRTPDIDAVSAGEPSIETAARGRVNGLRPSQLAMLQTMVDAGAPVPVAALVRRHAGASGVARASVSRSLHRLHARRFVDLLDKYGLRHVRVTNAGVEAVRVRQTDLLTADEDPDEADRTIAALRAEAEQNVETLIAQVHASVEQANVKQELERIRHERERLACELRRIQQEYDQLVRDWERLRHRL